MGVVDAFEDVALLVVDERDTENLGQDDAVGGRPGWPEAAFPALQRHDGAEGLHRLAVGNGLGAGLREREDMVLVVQFTDFQSDIRCA